MLQKCDKCTKRCLVRIKCKCSKDFCFKCRAPESHECSFDFQAKAQLTIRQQNPIVATEKLEKL